MNIKDYLKYYIGCRVLADDKDYGDFLGGALVPNEVDQIYYDIHLDEWPEGEIMPFNDDMSEDCRIKPILRRLEDMTEDEAINLVSFPVGYEILKVFKEPQGITFDYKWRDSNPKLNNDDGYSYSGTGVSFRSKHWTPIQFHYLLSRGFDLFGLINAGLAIDSKTVNPIIQ